MMPHNVEQVWQWGDGKRWRDDSQISVTPATEQRESLRYTSAVSTAEAFPQKRGIEALPLPLRLPPAGATKSRGSRILDDDCAEDRPVGLECDLDEPPICAVCLGDGRGKSVWSLPEHQLATPEVRK